MVHYRGILGRVQVAERSRWGLVTRGNDGASGKRTCSSLSLDVLDAALLTHASLLRMMVVLVVWEEEDKQGEKTNKRVRGQQS